MGKTIKELADEIGVSKTAIRKYMDDDFKSAYTTREGEKGTVIISDEGVTILKEKCNNPHCFFCFRIRFTTLK